MARRLIRGAALGLACIVALLAGSTLAQPERERAHVERLAAASRCDEALAAIDRIAAERALDARLEKVAGRCRMKLGRYAEAAASFERARTLDPTLPDLDLQLGIAYFHAEDLEAAGDAFGRARASGVRRPELDFYESLVALQLGGDPVAAAQTIERAGRERPESLQPAAGYYAALAWERAADRTRAERALESVAESNPGTVWETAARSQLDRLASTPLVTSRPWARVTGGLEYDSNVAYLGRGLATPDEIDSQGDVRGVWWLDAGTPLADFGGFTLGVRANHYGSAHVDARDYDLESPGLSFWLDRPLGERALLRLEAGYQYAWLGYDPYVGSWNVTPQLFVDFGRWGTSRLYAGVGVHDFESDEEDEPAGLGVGTPCPGGARRCGPAGIDERDRRDRDGVGVTAGLEHRVRLHEGKTELRAGPLFEHYAAEGREWDSWGVGASAGVRRALPYDFTVGLDALYLHRPYSSPTSYPDPRELASGVQYGLSRRDRTDDLFAVDVWVERPITERLTAQIRYGYLDNNSNAAVFDYDRHLVGGYLTYTWQGRETKR
ncbi:MAG: hypothetical protein DCC71_21460 [Proteobacteria bacterium]|nr:MAG: hypothetical protein DCC71_21460 [Pseudomonadota bacterium]